MRDYIKAKTNRIMILMGNTADYSGSVVKTKTLGFFNESLAC